MRLAGLEPAAHGLGNLLRCPQCLPKPHFSRIPFPSFVQEIPMITKLSGTESGHVA